MENIIKKALRKELPVISGVNTVLNNSNIDKIISDNEKVELKGYCTDFVNNYFMPSFIQINLLISEVFSRVQPVLNEYKKKKMLNDKDIIILYKGGNLMRRLYYNFSFNMPYSVRQKIDENFIKFFNKSDNDFMVLINPTIEKYEEIFEEVIYLFYWILNDIRNEILGDTKKYFEYSNLSEQVKKALLYSFFNKLIKNYSKINFVSKKDILIEPFSLGDDISTTKITDLGDTENAISISINKLLLFIREKEISKFALVRTRINFNITIDETKITSMGEHIDVAIAHRDDSIYHDFNIKTENDFYSFISDNILQNKNGYNTMNIDFLLIDIIKLLYSDKVYENKKYEKRIGRLFYLLMIKKINNKKLNNINDVINNFNKLKNNFNNIDKNKGDDLDSEYKMIYKYSKDQYDNFFNQDSQQLLEYVQKVILYCDKVMDILNDIEIFYKNPLLNSDDLLDITTV